LQQSDTKPNDISTEQFLGTTRTIEAHACDGSQIWVELSLNELETSFSRLPSFDQSKRYIIATMRQLTPTELEARKSRYSLEFEGSSLVAFASVSLVFGIVKSAEMHVISIELEFLGKGGFGAVYRARNKIDGQGK
jgi:hypothetical protein